MVSDAGGIFLHLPVSPYFFANIAKNCEEAIIPFIEKILPVSKDPKERAFCGLSMGSMTTRFFISTFPTFQGRNRGSYFASMAHLSNRSRSLRFFSPAWPE